MNYPQMMHMFQGIQDIIQRKCATGVAHQIILKEIVSGHIRVMIVKRHIKRDQRYANTALITGQRACRVIEEEELLWEETDHKVEEEDTSIKGEAEVEEEETSIKDKMDIIETTRTMEILEEISGEMQDRPHTKMGDKILANMKKAN